MTLLLLFLVGVAASGADFSVIDNGFYSYAKGTSGRQSSATDKEFEHSGTERVGRVGKLVISPGVLPKKELIITDSEVRFIFRDGDSVIQNLVFTGKDRARFLASEVVAVSDHFIQLFSIDSFFPKKGIEIFISDRTRRIVRHVTLVENQ